MTRKYLLLLTIVAFIGLLFGCHAGGNAPFINVKEEGNSQTLTATVNANGQLPAEIVFPSGATFNTAENNTMQEGVVVNITETKTSSLGVNPMGEPAYIYVYTITANLITQDALGNDVSTPVSSLEKPISVTLPTNHLGTTGIAYVGIRASESEPWRFSKVSEDGTVTISIRNLRASSTEKLSSSYKFGLFKMGIQLALFVYNKPVEETSSDISADSLNLICTEKILYDDSDKYTDDLDVALKIKGINLDRLRASDFAIKVIYRSENKTPESIKADGQSCSISTEEKADAAVSGKSYYVHTLTVPALNEGDLMSGEASLKFVLNLKGIAKADFPTSFLIEISNNGNIENLIPFTYSSSMSFTAEQAKEDEPEPEPEPEPQPTGSTYTITYNLDGGSLVEGFTNPSEYGEASETFTLNNPIKTGYTFAGWTGTDLEVATTEVTITTGSTGDREYTATWTENAPDTYTLTLSKGTGIATVTGDGTYKEGDSVTASCTMLAGYEFDSWTGDFTTEKITMPAKDVNMTANAKPIQYKITLDAKGGTLEKNSIEYNIETEEFNLPVPNKNGYDFTGWTGSNGDTPERVVKIEKGTTGNKSYTANYSAVAYTITYTLGADDVANDNPSGFNPDSETFTLKEPERTGYTFTGWTGSNGDTPQKEVTIAKGTTEKKSYTANWSINSYNLTINKGTGISTVTGDGMHEYNSSVTASCTMLAGYEFDKWTGDFTTATFNMPAQNATMTANARPSTYTITLSGCDGATVDYTSKDYNIETANFNLPTPTKNYYGFNGWVLNGGDPVESVTIAQGTHENRTYTADFTPSTFTITLNPSDGTVEYTSKNYNVETATFTLPTPTRNKCKFLGWSLNSGAPVESVEIAQGTHENRTYVARWTMDDVLTFTLAEGVTLEMRRCPAGTFQMGSPTTENGRDNNEKQHSVTISKDFWMGTYEVTQEQYFVIMGTNPSQFRDSDASVRPTTSANYPVERVASTYILTESTGFNAKLNASLTAQLAQLPLSYKFDLPTEAQWEYACRAGTTKALNNDKDITNIDSEDSNLNEVAWYKQNWGTANNKPHTVGGKAPNAWGLYDMHGNVWEWCKDMYADYPTTAVTNPFCEGGTYRVWRGGAWPKTRRAVVRLSEAPPP